MKNLIIFIALLVCPLVASASDVILNEWNAVGSGNFLDGPTSTKEDSFFRRVEENGGDWFELVITADHVDMRGWTFNWQDSAPTAGVITLSEHSFWQDVRSGLIITFIEDNDEGGKNTGTDISTAFRTDNLGDWWVNICTTEEYSKSAAEQLCFTDNSGNFSVNKDAWQLTIKNASNMNVQGPIGENLAGWLAGGINSEEVGKLEANPSSGITIGNYADGTSSSFGAPNIWSGGDEVQDFSALRSWAPVPEPMTLSLLAMGGMMIFRKKR